MPALTMRRCESARMDSARTPFEQKMSRKSESTARSVTGPKINLSRTSQPSMEKTAGKGWASVPRRITEPGKKFRQSMGRTLTDSSAQERKSQSISQVRSHNWSQRRWLDTAAEMSAMRKFFGECRVLYQSTIDITNESEHTRFYRAVCAVRSCVRRIQLQKTVLEAFLDLSKELQLKQAHLLQERLKQAHLVQEHQELMLTQDTSYQTHEENSVERNWRGLRKTVADDSDGESMMTDTSSGHEAADLVPELSEPRSPRRGSQGNSIIADLPVPVKPMQHPAQRTSIVQILRQRTLNITKPCANHLSARNVADHDTSETGSSESSPTSRSQRHSVIADLLVPKKQPQHHSGRTSIVDFLHQTPPGVSQQPADHSGLWHEAELATSENGGSESSPTSRSQRHSIIADLLVPGKPSQHHFGRKSIVDFLQQTTPSVSQQPADQSDVWHVVEHDNSEDGGSESSPTSRSQRHSIIADLLVPGKPSQHHSGRKSIVDFLRQTSPGVSQQPADHSDVWDLAEHDNSENGGSESSPTSRSQRHSIIADLLVPGKPSQHHSGRKSIVDFLRQTTPGISQQPAKNFNSRHWAEHDAAEKESSVSSPTLRSQRHSIIKELLVPGQLTQHHSGRTSIVDFLRQTTPSVSQQASAHSDVWHLAEHDTYESDRAGLSASRRQSGHRSIIDSIMCQRSINVTQGDAFDASRQLHANDSASEAARAPTAPNQLPNTGGLSGANVGRIAYPLLRKPSAALQEADPNHVTHILERKSSIACKDSKPYNVANGSIACQATSIAFQVPPASCGTRPIALGQSSDDDPKRGTSILDRTASTACKDSEPYNVANSSIVCARASIALQEPASCPKRQKVGGNRSDDQVPPMAPPLCQHIEPNSDVTVADTLPEGSGDEWREFEYHGGMETCTSPLDTASKAARDMSIRRTLVLPSHLQDVLSRCTSSSERSDTGIATGPLEYLQELKDLRARDWKDVPHRLRLQGLSLRKKELVESRLNDKKNMSPEDEETPSKGSLDLKSTACDPDSQRGSQSDSPRRPVYTTAGSYKVSWRLTTNRPHPIDVKPFVADAVERELLSCSTGVASVSQHLANQEREASHPRLVNADSMNFRSPSKSRSAPPALRTRVPQIKKKVTAKIEDVLARLKCW